MSRNTNPLEISSEADEMTDDEVAESRAEDNRLELALERYRESKGDY